MPNQTTRRYGGDGWVRFEDPAFGGVLYLHLDKAGVVKQLFLDSTGEITAGTLRAVPLAKLRSLATSRPNLALALWPHPDGNPVDVAKQLDGLIHGRQNAPTDTDARLTPTSPANGLTDRFLGDVAAAYRAAVARGERPNKALAAQVGFPPAVRQSTVERWVYLARKKGLLSQTRKGSIG